MLMTTAPAIRRATLGQDIQQTTFTETDYHRFRQQLNRELEAFQNLLNQPGFGEGPSSFGAELELYIIDGTSRPYPINQRLLELAQDPQLTLELNRFNLEYNFTPQIDTPNAFSNMLQQMHGALDFLGSLAKEEGARVVPVGILPTLKAGDMGLEAITDVPRYHVLAKALRDKRGRDFHISIDGQEQIDMHWPDVSLEGANTSFQFHYRVNPGDFAASYNAAQLVTPLVLAVAANSPLFLGRRLWHETRVALFKQSIDYRLDDALDKHLPARVLFGLGWVRQGIHELFTEGTCLFDPLLPIADGQDPFEQMHQDGAPKLSALRLHQGSVWTWNRPIYDPADNGHLRIEIRSLPAGPSVENMISNSALISGLMKGLNSEIDSLIAGIPFRYAEQNFYRAAKHGLNATLFWPNLKAGRLEERPVTDILKAMLPVAQRGLDELNINPSDSHRQLEIIQQALQAKTAGEHGNGAEWQLLAYKNLRKDLSDEQALSQLVENYYGNTRTLKPVHEWSTKI